MLDVEAECGPDREVRVTQAAGGMVLGGVALRILPPR